MGQLFDMAECGVGDQAQGGGALLSTEAFLQNHSRKKKTWGLHIWAAFYRAAPQIGSRTPAIFTEGCSTVTETHT